MDTPDPGYAHTQKAPLCLIVYGGAVAMLGQPPAGTFVGKKVHLQNPPATARADHGHLFAVPVFLDHIENASPEVLG